MKKPKLYDAGKPINRFHLFGNVMRHHLVEVMLSSLYIFMFGIPMIVWIFLLMYVPMFGQNNLVALLVTNGVLALTFAVFGLGWAGGMQFYKKLCFGEGASLKEDFFGGIKKNGKLFFLIFLAQGIWYLLLHITMGVTSGMEIDGNLKMAMIGVGYGLFFLIAFVHIFMMSEATMFEGGFFSLFTSSLRLSYATLYKGILFYLIVLLPLLIYEFLPFQLFNLIGLLVGAFIYFGLSALCLTLFCNSVYDQSVFKTQYPEMYRKGLAKEKEEQG